MTDTKTTTGWEMLHIVGGLLVPITIGIATIVVTGQLAGRASEEAAQRERLTRLSTVPSYIQLLTTGTEQQRMMAIRVLNKVLPEDAPDLLQGIIAGKPDTPDAKAAAGELEMAPVTALTTGLYDGIKSRRIASFNALGKLNAPAGRKIQAVLEAIQSQPTNLDGTINAWRFLDNFSGPELTKFASQIGPLAELTSSNGRDTATVAQHVMKKASGN